MLCMKGREGAFKPVSAFNFFCLSLSLSLAEYKTNVKNIKQVYNEPGNIAQDFKQLYNWPFEFAMYIPNDATRLCERCANKWNTNLSYLTSIYRIFINLNVCIMVEST